MSKTSIQEDPIDRIDRLERWSEDLERRFAESFPDGDHMAHRLYHELMIKNIEAKERLTQAISEKTIGGLVFSVIVGILYACWLYIKQQLNHHQ